MPRYRPVFFAFASLLPLASACYAQDSSFTDEQIKAAAEAQENERALEQQKDDAPWHFLLDVKSSKRNASHAGNKVDLTGYINQIYTSPPSQRSVKSQLLSFSFYCGNTFPDAPVDPCRPYLQSSRLEIWGKFTIGSEGRVLPNSLIPIAIEPQ